MRNFFVALTSANLLLSVFVTPVFASENKDDDRTGRYSEEEIALIKEMQATNPEFDISEGEIVMIKKVTKSLDHNGEMTTRGAIGSNYMTMTLYVQRVNSSNKAYDDFKFQVKADWISTPFFRMQDAVALAWSDNFSQYSHSCNAYYYSLGLAAGKTSQIKSAPEQGVGYSVEASDWYGQALDYVILTVYAKKNAGTGTAVLASEYAHATVALGTGFNVDFKNGGGSIGFSTAGAFDTMSTDKYFEY